MFSFLFNWAKKYGHFLTMKTSVPEKYAKCFRYFKRAMCQCPGSIAMLHILNINAIIKAIE